MSLSWECLYSGQVRQLCSIMSVVAESINAGFTKDDLIPVSSWLLAANKSRIVGALLVCLDGKFKVRIYPVSPWFMSLEAMVDFGLINHDSTLFPDELIIPPLSTNPKILLSITLPKSLPFKAKPENIPHINKCLLEAFSASTFNTCPYQTLPSCLALKFKFTLMRMLTLKPGLASWRVPWCYRVGTLWRASWSVPSYGHHLQNMIACLGRTVDLSHLNKHCKRGTFFSQSPFQVACKIPNNTWKTVTDAWNGYHGMVLRECDGHLTTFITPRGNGGILVPHMVLFLLEMGITGGSVPFLPPSRTKRDASMTLAIMM